MLLNPCCLMTSCLTYATSITAWTNKLINKKTLYGVKMILNLNSYNERFAKLSEIKHLLKYGQYKKIYST